MSEQNAINIFQVSPKMLMQNINININIKDTLHLKNRQKSKESKETLQDMVLCLEENNQ